MLILSEIDLQPRKSYDVADMEVGKTYEFKDVVLMTFRGILSRHAIAMGKKFQTHKLGKNHLAVKRIK